MDLSFNDRGVQLRAAVRGYLERHNGFARRMSSARSEAGWNPDLWHGLADDLGILGIAVPDAQGGSGGLQST